MPPAQARAQRSLSHGFSLGETLRLALTEADGADLLVSADNGRALRLTGLSEYSQGLREGDVLLVRVLATDPLELEFCGTTPRAHASATVAPRAPLTDQAAMRLDQTALRRITWREPSAAALANSWRALVHGRWRSDEAYAPPAGAAYAAPGSAVAREALNTTLPDDIQRWSFPLYAWGGQPMLLRLVQADPDEDARPAHRRARMLAIRVECVLPGLGPIMLHVQWVSGGIQLSLAAERSAAIAPLHDALPRISAALARIELRLYRCSIAHGQLPAPTVPRQELLPRGPAAAVAPALYRAAAETVLVLAGLTP
ncbi:MAG: hypothetical protein QM639_13095 [Rhodocyclaceae bacterium]